MTARNPEKLANQIPKTAPTVPKIAGISYAILLSTVSSYLKYAAMAAKTLAWFRTRFRLQYAPPSSRGWRNLKEGKEGRGVSLVERVGDEDGFWGGVETYWMTPLKSTITFTKSRAKTLMVQLKPLGRLTW